MNKLVKSIEERAWLVLAAAFIAAAVVIFGFAIPMLEERSALVTQQQQLERRCAQLRQFSVRHNDYAAYAAERRKELELLHQQFPKEPSVHAALEAVRSLGVNNNVVLREVKLPDKERTRKEKSAQSVKAYPLQLSGAGEFFLVLRWLRQVERQGFTIQSLRLQEEGVPGNVRVDLEIALYAVE